MGSPRAGAIGKLERIDGHHHGLTQLLRDAQDAFADGVITAREGALLLGGLATAVATAALIGVDAQSSDMAMQLIGILANTADPTSEWFGRRYRETSMQLAVLADETPAPLPDLPLAIAGGTHNEG